MRLLLLAGSAGAAARVVPFCPAGAELHTSAGGGDAVGAEPVDVAVACDAAGVALLAGVGGDLARVALVPRYGDPGDDLEGLAEVDLWAVGHAAVAEVLKARGVAADAIEVTGVPVPPGFAPAADRASSRAGAKLPADEAVLVVQAEAADGDLGPLLVQLGLLDGRPWLLFDVGDDLAAAERLRAEVPRLGLRAKMFAAGPEAGGFTALADLVVGPPEPFAAARALACGAAYVALGRPARGALDAAVEAGGVRVCLAVGRLAADVDVLRAPERLAAARAAATALALPDASARLQALLGRAAEQRDALAGRRRRRGLPVGLEDLTGPEAAAAPAPTPRRPAPDLDEEIAALRRKLGK